MNHTEVLNALIEKFGYSSYLEIGVGDGVNYEEVKCDRKEWLDPVSPNLGFGNVMTSDKYFEGWEDNLWARKFDLIFIDGDHHAKQVYKDIINSMKVLNKGGCIVVHDCNPESEVMQKVPREVKEWTGDGWKAWVYCRDVEDFCINTDYGIGIIYDPSDGNLELTPDDLTLMERPTYQDLVKNREKFLNLISVHDFKQWLNGG